MIEQIVSIVFYICLAGIFVCLIWAGILVYQTCKIVKSIDKMIEEYYKERE